MAALFQQLFSECALVDQATEDNDSSTPGFIYNDIIQLTLKSGEDCAKVVHHLFTRLNLRRPKIKLKALALMRQLMSRGPIQCRREILRRAESLRACLSFRGPPDPLHGDAQYAAVRDAAQALINSLYDTSDPSTTPVGSASGSGSHMTGFGNVANSSGNTTSNYADSSYSSSSTRSMGSSTTTSGQYTYVQSQRAIGHFIPVPDEDSSQDRVSNAAGAVIDFIRSKVTGVSDTPQNQRGAAPAPHVATPGVRSDGSRFVNYQQHLLNPDGLNNVQPMGGWADDPSEAGGSQSATTTSSLTTPLLEQLLSGSATLSRSEMASAIQTILSSGVDTESVIRQLCDVAVAAQSAVRWQQRLRALALLDALRQHAQPNSFLASQQFFTAFQNAYGLFALHKSVQDKAEQLWLALYGPDRPSPVQQELAAKLAAQKSPSLFDGLSAASEEEQQQHQAVRTDAGVASIFDSLSLSGPAPPSPQTASSAKMGGLNADDLLLLNFGTQSPAATAATTSSVKSFPASQSNASPKLNDSRTTAATPSNNGNLLDLSGLSFPPTAPTSRPLQSQTGSSYDSFSFVADEFKKKDSASGTSLSAPSSGGSGSSFNFL